LQVTDLDKAACFLYEAGGAASGSPVGATAALSS
jgi:hypothetical protein